MKNEECIYSAARDEIRLEYKAMCAKTPASLIEKTPTTGSGFFNELLPSSMDSVKNMFGSVMESEYLRQLVNSDIAKTAAQGALVGAAIAIPVPFVGPLVGGAFGALATTSMYVMKGGKK